jgi:hypothetical protein
MEKVAPVRRSRTSPATTAVPRHNQPGDLWPAEYRTGQIIYPYQDAKKK